MTKEGKILAQQNEEADQKEQELEDEEDRETIDIERKYQIKDIREGNFQGPDCEEQDDHEPTDTDCDQETDQEDLTRQFGSSNQESKPNQKSQPQIQQGEGNDENNDDDDEDETEEEQETDQELRESEIKEMHDPSGRSTPLMKNLNQNPPSLPVSFQSDDSFFTKNSEIIPSTISTPAQPVSKTASIISPNSDILDKSIVYESPIQSDLPDSSPCRPRLHQQRSRSQSDSSQTPQPDPQVKPSLSFSLWDHLKYEINANHDESLLLREYLCASSRSERISNFLNVPISIEKMITFGFMICLDSFLSVFTILPIKFCYSLFKLVASLISRTLYSIQLFKNKIIGNHSSDDSQKSRLHRKRLNVSCKVDLIQGLLIILVCVFLHHVTDASRMYHSIRGQEIVKLYVIFNALEIADRLCCSFGQDILDSLFSPSTLGRRVDGSQPHVKPIFLFILAFIFTVAHTLVLFYQLVSLNVAINSFDHSLITLLISNQFVEIKGAVFKKFEKENLFQMSCADIVERFQLFLMLTIIALRNWIELTGSSVSSSHAHNFTYQYLPTSFNLCPSLMLFQNTFSPVLIVMLSEVVVDWLKHAFITKFNHIRPSVYGRFIDVLCKDILGDEESENAGGTLKSDQKPFVDKSPAVSRRLGLSVLPMFCLTVRVSFQALDMLSDTSDKEFSLFAQDTTEIGASKENSLKFSFQYLKNQLLVIPSSKIFNTNPPLYLDPLDRNRIVRFAGSTFSSFQVKCFMIISFVIVMTFLILCKLYLGIQIRSFSIERVKTLNQRLAEDQANGRNRLPIGLSPSEILKEENDRKMIEQAEFDVPLALKNNPGKHRDNSTDRIKNSNFNRDEKLSSNLSHRHPHPKQHDDLYPDQPTQYKKKLSMDELSRFDMVRSRIW